MIPLLKYVYLNSLPLINPTLIFLDITFKGVLLKIFFRFNISGNLHFCGSDQYRSSSFLSSWYLFVLSINIYWGPNMWLAQCLLLRNLQTSKRDKEKKNTCYEVWGDKRAHGIDIWFSLDGVREIFLEEKSLVSVDIWGMKEVNMGRGGYSTSSKWNRMC